MLFFDTRTESWNEVAILPIMPDFSRRVGFYNKQGRSINRFETSVIRYKK